MKLKAFSFKIDKADTRYQLHSQLILSCINVLIKYLTGVSFFTCLDFLAYGLSVFTQLNAI